MNNLWAPNIIRFIVLLLVQVLVLKNVVIFPPYVHFLIYPLFILMLPFTLEPALVLLLAFLMGMMVDLFYDSVGLHTAALVITAFARGPVSRSMEPRGGYKNTHFPNKSVMGIGWFSQYAAILMAIHLFFYFLYEVFVFSRIGLVLAETFLSFFASMALIILYQYIINPRR